MSVVYAFGGSKWLCTGSLALLVLMPSIATAQAPASTPASTSTDQLLKPEQLDALVAPIALYPDTLLSLVLMKTPDWGCAFQTYSPS